MISGKYGSIGLIGKIVKKLETESQVRVKAGIGRVGYNSVGYFSKVFKKRTGYTVNEYKELKQI